MKRKKKDYISSRHFILDFRRVTGSSSPVSSSLSPRRWLEYTKHWSLASQTPLLILQNLIKASKNLHNSLCGCFSMFLRTIALKHGGASFYESKPQTQHINRHSPLQRLRLKPRLMLKNILRLMFGLRLVLKFVIFLRFASSRALCFRISTRWLNMSFKSWEFGNSKTIFSMALKNLRAWINTVSLEGNNLVWKDMRRERLSFARNAQEQN